MISRLRPLLKSLPLLAAAMTAIGLIGAPGALGATCGSSPQRYHSWGFLGARYEGVQEKACVRFVHNTTGVYVFSDAKNTAVGTAGMWGNDPTRGYRFVTYTAVVDVTTGVHYDFKCTHSGWSEPLTLDEYTHYRTCNKGIRATPGHYYTANAMNEFDLKNDGNGLYSTGWAHSPVAVA